MSISTALEAVKDTGTNVLNAKEDRYGGVIVNLEEPMDPKAFVSLLESSMSNWRNQGKKGVWIKLPIAHVNLVEVIVKAGFRYHHAEADYLMLVHWIPNTADTLPANASHRVGIGAFVVNDKREVLVVQGGSGWFKGTGVWKLPTGIAEEGEDICDAAVREVKEETGGNNINITRIHKLAFTAMEAMKDTGTNVLNAKEDRYGGVTVYLDEPMDPTVLASLLQSSISNWRDQGKKSLWIKLPNAHLNLFDAVWKAGFRYHHAGADYLMLVHWIPITADTLPANTSHRVGIGAFVINDKREVLVVQERDGWFKSTGVCKLPTGTVEVGEDISAAAIRQVKEQTGIETEFVEVLTFRQSHKSFSQKSDLFIVCMLQPLSFDIQIPDSECAAAQWMPVQEYAAQPFVQLTSSLDSVAKICLEKLGGSYSGFTPLPSLACNCKGYDCETFMDYLGCSS